MRLEKTQGYLHSLFLFCILKTDYVGKKDTLESFDITL